MVGNNEMCFLQKRKKPEQVADNEESKLERIKNSVFPSPA